MYECWWLWCGLSRFLTLRNSVARNSPFRRFARTRTMPPIQRPDSPHPDSPMPPSHRPDWSSPLSLNWLCSQQHWSLVDSHINTLLDHGAAIAHLHLPSQLICQDLHGETALHLALRHNAPQSLVKRLIRLNGSAVNAKDMHGRKPGETRKQEASKALTSKAVNSTAQPVSPQVISPHTSPLLTPARVAQAPSASAESPSERRWNALWESPEHTIHPDHAAEEPERTADRRVKTSSESDPRRTTLMTSHA